MDGFSEAGIESRFRGKIDRVKLVLQIFLEDNVDILSTIDEAVNKNAHDDLRSYFHKIKGSALNINADLLAQVCERLEWSSRHNQPVSPVDYQQFKSFLGATLHHAKAYCER